MLMMLAGRSWISARPTADADDAGLFVRCCLVFHRGFNRVLQLMPVMLVVLWRFYRQIPQLRCLLLLCGFKATPN